MNGIKAGDLVHVDGYSDYWDNNVFLVLDVILLTLSGKTHAKCLNEDGKTIKTFFSDDLIKCDAK